MDLSFELKESVGVLKVSGRMDELEFRKKFKEYAEQTVNFVFDLSSFDYLEYGEALGCIIACLKDVSEKDGDIRIGGFSKNTKLVFEITRAYKIFDIFDDVDSAVMSYQTD